MNDDLETQLVTANHALAAHGTFQALGHVSVRKPGGDTMLISESCPPHLVAPDGIIEMSLDGQVVDRSDADPYLEHVIHRAIYRSRPDVNAIVHHHAQEVMPFATTDLEYKPVVPGGVLFRDGVPEFADYDDEYGRLVVTEAEGERMAASLGDHRAQFLRGHGANVVGRSIKELVVVSFLFAQNADRQLTAEQAGSPYYYTGPPSSVEAMEEVLLGEVPVERLWNYLVDRIPDR